MFYFPKKFNISKFNLLFFYNFLYKHLNFLNIINLYKNYTNLNYLVLVNFRNKQPKLNLIDLALKKKYIYTLGLVLKLLNMYKKASRRNINFLKYLVSYVLKKYNSNLANQKIIFIIKGLVKNYIKYIYYFKSLILNFNISLLYINPIKIFKFNKRKKKRSIKRRIYKKLVDFNKI